MGESSVSNINWNARSSEILSPSFEIYAICLLSTLFGSSQKGKKCLDYTLVPLPSWNSLSLSVLVLGTRSA